MRSNIRPAIQLKFYFFSLLTFEDPKISKCAKTQQIGRREMLDIDFSSAREFFGIVWKFKLFCWICCRTQKSQHCLVKHKEGRNENAGSCTTLKKEIWIGIPWMRLEKNSSKKEIWKGISWIRLDADWIGWDWRDRRRFLFEAKLMTRWFKKLSHLHLILILSSKEMKRYYRHILMLYTMPGKSWFQNWRCHSG